MLFNFVFILIPLKLCYGRRINYDEQLHPCTRTCDLSEPPMRCTYNLHVESYRTMSKACNKCPKNLNDCLKPSCIMGNGKMRPITVVNRQLPGTSIQVCLYDTLIVNVINDLSSDTTSIHFHGHGQEDTPHLDGVPFVTQYPILPGNKFVYEFKKLHFSGTHMYYSQSGTQRADGLFGPFIVRTAPEHNFHKKHYDKDLPEHVITVAEWMDKTGTEKMTGYLYADGDLRPTSILVNGKGLFQKSKYSYKPYGLIERFFIEMGTRYRFRMIHAGFSNCPIEFSVDNHTVTLISTDGNDIVPVEMETFIIHPGERFDFVISGDQERELYWMRFKGQMDCEYNKVYQVAILQYPGISKEKFPKTIPTYDDVHEDAFLAWSDDLRPAARIVNDMNAGIESDTDLSLQMSDLKSLFSVQSSLKRIPDIKYFVSYDLYIKDNSTFDEIYDISEYKRIPQFNCITMKLLPTPLLSKETDLKSDVICNKATTRNCRQKLCACPHIVQLPLDAMVELILIDEGVNTQTSHSFHLHGHVFRVIGTERLGNTRVSEIKKLDKRGLLNRNINNAPEKDTVVVPNGGYTIIRLMTTNPGYWILQSQNVFYAEAGMTMVFKCGQDADIPPMPSPMCPYQEIKKHSRKSNLKTVSNLTSEEIFCQENGRC